MKFLPLALFLLLVIAREAVGRSATRGPLRVLPDQAVLITQEPHHHLLYQNDDLRIYDVLIPAHQSTLLEEHDFNYIFISLSNSIITLRGPGTSPVQLDLPPGAVHFGTAGSSRTLTNDGDQPFLDVTIEFLNPKLSAVGCTCNGGIEDAICLCPRAPSLPADWQARIGRISLAGVTLSPGAIYEIASSRTTRMLIPITPFDMMDVSAHEPRNLVVRLPVGEFHWLAPGPHTIQNLSSAPMKFVSVEF